MSVPKHKVFITFHHEDQKYKDQLTKMLEGSVVDKSVGDGDIDDSLEAGTIRRKIRDEFIADATVTIVLVGKCTWQRKYVDWEIGSSLSNTKNNSKCGLLGILLPNHPNFPNEKYKSSLIPPRLADNCKNKYAKIHDWTVSSHSIQKYVDSAFTRRNQKPDNSRPQFRQNKSGSCSQGWSE